VRAETVGREFVIHRAVVPLHFQQPLDLPAHFFEQVRQRGVAQLEVHFLQRFAMVTPRLKHHGRGEGAGRHILVVVARVVPAAARLAKKPRLLRHFPGFHVVEPAVLAVHVAGLVRVMLSRIREINRAAAARLGHRASDNP